MQMLPLDLKTSMMEATSFGSSIINYNSHHMKEKQFYLKPETTVLTIRIEQSVLTGSLVEQNSTVGFEDLTDGGDFAW